MSNDGRSRSRDVKEFTRLRAIELYGEGMRIKEIARVLGVHRVVVGRWIKVFRKEGAKGLKKRPIKGRPRILTDEECAELRSLIVGGDPRQLGIDFGLWTRRIIVDLVWERFGKLIGLTAVGQALHRMGIVPLKPLRRAYERDADAIEQWKSTTLPALRQEAREIGGELLFLDEAGIRSDCVLGKTWGEIGSKVVVATSGRRESANAISAVSESGAFWFDVYSGGMNAEVFIEELQLLARAIGKPMILVVDGHPAHRARKVKDFLDEWNAEHDNTIQLSFLPGYAPDLNPDELVWNYIKHKGGPSRVPLKHGESMFERVVALLEQVDRLPSLVASFVRRVFEECGLDVA